MRFHTHTFRPASNRSSKINKDDRIVMTQAFDRALIVEVKDAEKYLSSTHVRKFFG